MQVNMEHNAFWDYCKAENSDDEEDNRDVQSRLYAEIYYASNSLETADTKLGIKYSIPCVNNEELNNGINIHKASSSNDDYAQTTVGISNRQVCATNDSRNESKSVEEDDKSNVKSVCPTHEVEKLHVPTESSNNLTVPCTKMLQHFQESIELSECNKHVVTCQKLDTTPNNTDPHTIHNTSNDIPLKLKTEIESEGMLKSVQSLNPEMSTSAIQSPHLNSRKYNGNNSEGIQGVECTETKEDNSCDDILKKYEFSKLFINELYLKKYESLEQMLQNVDERNERILRDKEQEGINIQGEEVNQLPLDEHTYLSDQTKTDTRYDILSTNKKMQNTRNDLEEVTLLSSDMDSDSEESILEVPIPPKPKPPIINLQDSDASSIASSDSDVDRSCLFVAEDENSLKDQNDKEIYGTEKDSDADSDTGDHINDSVINHMTQDMMLNCTEVEKGASNIKEIMEMSKTAESEKCSDKSKSDSDKNQSVILSEVHNKNLNTPNRNVCINDKNKTFEFLLPLEPAKKSRVVYERDKPIDFTEDVSISNFDPPKECNLNRKRPCENDIEPCSSAKQRKRADNENEQPEASLKEHQDTNESKSKQESWEEYFFRPMSDNVKTFYNESRGQENYDVQKIQSKMSKDRRLWAILDEDLMPNLSKHKRFWNMRCNNCLQKGHQKYDCPEPRKPPLCHMCGTQGHTGTRCPQKMCLTCGTKQGTFRKTCESCRILYCNTCKAMGHKPTECPDLWRRFHQTTQNSKINIPEDLSDVMKPADLLYCCNCAKRGHDSSMCEEYRWSLHFPTPPFVSNYANGTGGEDFLHVNTTKEDPYRFLSKKCTRCIKNLVFLEGENNLRGYNVIYSYGGFYTKKANGEEFVRKLPPELISKMTNFLEGRAIPSFLDELIKIIKFEIKIFYTFEKVLLLRIRSLAWMAHYVDKFFVFWIKLEEEDKLSLNMHMKLPRNKPEMIQLLTTTIQELGEDIHDPRKLHTQIEQLKKKMSGGQDTRGSSNISNEILNLRRKFLKVYFIKNGNNKEVSKLRKFTKRLQKSGKNSVELPLYMNILVTYNTILLPRAIPNSEVEIFFNQYYKQKKQKKKQNETKEINPNINQSSGTQSTYNPPKSGLYERFKASVCRYPTYTERTHANRFVNARQESKQNKQIPPPATFITNQSSKNINISNSTTHSSKITQKEDKQMSTIVSSSIDSSSKTNIQPDNSVSKSNTKNSPGRDNRDTNIAECSDIYRKDVIQLPCDMAIPSDIQETNKQGVSINVPVPSRTGFDIPSKHPTNDQSNSNIVSCIEKGSGNNVEKDTEVISNDMNAVEIPNLQQDSTIYPTESTTKKKKSKKSKKAKRDFENNPQHGENQITNVDALMKSKAEAVINNALEFNLPYMNKAVTEVQKRISDKSIKQEHVDVLQKLINLEKEHQKHVTSFCNYLK